MAWSKFKELNRRNVFRVAFAYVVLAWLMAQVAELLLDAFGAPAWVLKTLLALLLVGFPIAVFFAWAFELTPEGVKRESEVDRERSITKQTGRNIDRAIIILLLLALAWFAWDRYQASDVNRRAAASAEEDMTNGASRVNSDDAVPVVAVLPFKASGSDDGGFLAAGLHDDLLTRLAKLDAYRVISRTSMMEYADTTKNMRQIGQELGAGYILEGGVQALSGRVRINAQLISAVADEHLWAEIYDRELTPENLFDVQAELALAIASELHTELSPSDQALVKQIPTRNMAAYNSYLLGLQLSKSSGYVGMQQDRDAVTALAEAVQLDPEFAEAWARLSRARIKDATSRGYDAESSQEALIALGRARALKPGMLDSELAWAEYLYRFLHEYDSALKTLEALGSQAARDAEALQMMAWLERRLGRYQAGYARLQKAQELAPRDPSIYLHLTHYAWLIDNCESAGQYAEALLSLAPEMTGGKVLRAEYELECNGDTTQATQIYKSLNIADIGGWIYPYRAAMHESDAEWAMTLIEWSDTNPEPIDDAWEAIGAAQVNRYLLRDEKSVALDLHRAENLLGKMASTPEVETDAEFAWAKAYVYSLKGDADSAAFWLEQSNRLFQAETKGDVFAFSQRRFGNAEVLAQAGLHDEAVEELRIMLEEPGGHRFPIVDGHPVFHALEIHPGYIELLERFGTSRFE